ncbi:MAG: right-handed parallel beta-helix repeat-containing protein [Sedimentisphaerales bacterium]|nr:right-handed parallel beta-helix repeat-containing protein [Sedimentisphaerales bacterium]
MKALTCAQGAVLVALVLVATVGPVRAATTHYVDDDGVADFHTIQAAVDAAATGDTILLLPGRYTGNGNWDVVVTGKAITVRNADPNNAASVAGTVIDCQAADSVGHRAFVVTEDSGVHLTLAGLTIVNGETIYHGGGVWCKDARLTVINCTFTDNEALWWGGAVCCVNSTADFRGCSFSNGNSLALTGGGVYCGNTIASFANCTFESNIGNGIVTRESGTTITDCVFENNVGQDGGGLHSYAGFDNREAYLNVTRCTFIGNSSSASGGAFHGINAQGKIDGCVFMANTAAADGGGLFTHRSSPMVTNCLFLANVANGIGGAVANVFESKPQFLNCTFVNNQASAGGVMASSYNADPLLSQSILWNNTAVTGPSLYLKRNETGSYLAKATVKYCDLQYGLSGTHTDPGCTLTWGKGNFDEDPLFTGPFRDDYHLSTDSPCIDAGDPAYAPAVGAQDLDGSPRRYGNAVDLGVYEYQGLGPIYRFWSPTLKGHFYTISGAERDRVLREWPDVWSYEDVAFYAYYRLTEPGLVPVYRFWSPILKTHLYTIDETEKNTITKEMADMWIPEGPVFYVYPAGEQPLGTFPVYRFWSASLQRHFYTISEDEKDHLLKAYPKEWAYLGVAWYAFVQPNQPKQVAYKFAGGSDDVWYAMTLKALVDGKEVPLDKPDVQLLASHGEMEMAVDFTNLTCTFQSLDVQTETVQHYATISTPDGSLALALTMAVGGTFSASTPRGPFAIDPATGTFADYVGAEQGFPADQASFAYSGSVTLGGTRANFTRVSNALQFELQYFGVFQNLNLIPDGIAAYMPMTFQWHRPNVKDLLADVMVNGRRVQLYVTYVYLGTQGLWEGQAIK